MAEFFPRHTIQWQVRELHLPRRVSLSLIGMALATGVVVRLFRLLILSHGPLTFLRLVFGFVIGYSLLFGLTTAYLGNHPVRQWLWRAPLFAVLESVGEAATSAVLIAAGVERYGSQVAAWSDWPSMALQTLLRRLEWILLFALVLAIVVQLVRRFLLRQEGRGPLLKDVHEERTAGRE